MRAEVRRNDADPEHEQDAARAWTMSTSIGDEFEQVDQPGKPAILIIRRVRDV